MGLVHVGTKSSLLCPGSMAMGHKKDWYSMGLAGTQQDWYTMGLAGTQWNWYAMGLSGTQQD